MQSCTCTCMFTSLQQLQRYATQDKVSLGEDGAYVRSADFPGLPESTERPALIFTEHGSNFTHYLHSEHELVRRAVSHALMEGHCNHIHVYVHVYIYIYMCSSGHIMNRQSCACTCMHILVGYHFDPCALATHMPTIFSSVAVWLPSCKHRHWRAEVWLLPSRPDLRHQGQCMVYMYMYTSCQLSPCCCALCYYVTETIQLVNITNHTAGVVVCIWVTTDADSFHVVPDEQEIAAGKTASFAVKFKPVHMHTLSSCTFKTKGLKFGMLLR